MVQTRHEVKNYWDDKEYEIVAGTATGDTPDMFAVGEILERRKSDGAIIMQKWTHLRLSDVKKLIAEHEIHEKVIE
jgi:hypothetical protein